MSIFIRQRGKGAELRIKHKLLRTRERVPLDWAMTQNNLSTALVSLSERESGAARLEGAVTAYREEAP